MSERGRDNPKRSRGAYSRLICIGCRERRIRCDLPREVEIPFPGELRTVQTPCYRCKRLGIACVVRQTVLGRGSLARSSPKVLDSRPIQTSGTVSHVDDFVIELPLRTVARTWPAVGQDETRPAKSSAIAQNTRFSDDLSQSRGGSSHWNGDALLVHTPQSAETVVIIRALDTIRCEHVEDTWPRHLPAHIGQTPALDLSIKAIVAACAYARGVPKLTPKACYQALAVALDAVQANIKQSRGKPSDDILASTALLAPFEGVIRKRDTPLRLHIEGMAAILAARPAGYPVSQLARDILDFYACDSAIMACIRGTPSAFESVDQAYFANDKVGHSDSNRAQLKSLGIELFIRIPRLVRLVGSLRAHRTTQKQLLSDAVRLLESLLKLRDPQAEEQLLQTTEVRPRRDHGATTPLHHSLHFASVEEFEAFTYYWQGRLSLLRLEWHLSDFLTSSSVQGDSTSESRVALRSKFGPTATNEISRVVLNILMSSEYAATLRLRKRRRLFAHGMVVVWGVAMDVPLALGHGQGKDPLGPVFDLLLQRVNVALAAHPNLTREDMNTAADILIGRQSHGRYADLYGL